MTPDTFSADDVSWHVSTASASAGGQCVEAGPINDGSGRVAVRHSKDHDGPIITSTRKEWIDFVKGIQKGEFDF